ncbi:hypothetical protein QBC46DRAFT_248670 [Diplogelasinospora grovesii]|uniref:Pentatricopeptide repeat-containing protein n=1 Tax=Diplogelasinospora grovesii TaxID=303347 RepID=A0AAN6NLQ0_9PEZI|nr:hypothetical protein QBC46DRAFT_248670 [Diplogelasinospora grovesii]
MGSLHTSTTPGEDPFAALANSLPSEKPVAVVRNPGEDDPFTPVVSAPTDRTSTRKGRNKPIIQKYEPYPDLSHKRIKQYEPYPERPHKRGHIWPEVQKELKSERSFDSFNYPSTDRDFWDKFDELWGESDVDASILPAKSPQPRKKVREDPRTPAQKKRLRNDTTTQFVRLMNMTAPEKQVAAKNRFNRWKRDFSDIMMDDTTPRKKGQARPKKKDTAWRDLRWLLRFEKVPAMREAWQEQTLERRELIWTWVMATALRNTSPDVALSVLEATFEENVAPFYAVRDCMKFLARHSSTLTAPEGKPAYNGALANLLLHMLRASSQRYIQLQQHDIYLISKELDSEKLAELYQELSNYQHPLHTYTKLQFAGRLAKDMKQKQFAFEILRDMIREDALDLNTPHGAALCTSILAFSEEDSKNVENLPAARAQLYEGLLQLGLRPNLINFTAIIRNLCLSRNLGTAWQVYEMMREQGIEPDLHVYSTLLNGAKLVGSMGSIGKITREALAKDIGGPILWNDILHALFLASLAEARARHIKPPRVMPAFRPMVQAYTKFFKMEPLQTLALSDLSHHLKEDKEVTELYEWQSLLAKVTPLLESLPADRELLEPGADTLGIMLIGYVKGFSKAYNIIAFYSHFRKLLKSGDPVAVRLVQEKGTLVHDIVIKALLEWNGMLRVALDVVSDMLKDATAAASSTSSLHPAPSVHTWSILLNGFMFHKQHEQGERILHMMRDHGIEPNVVTWNTLTAGYAREQKVTKTVGALQRLEKAGHKADDFTMRAFSYLANREGALTMMEAMVEKRKKRLEEEEERKGRGLGVGELGMQREAMSIEDELRQMESQVEDNIAETMNGEMNGEEEQEQQRGGPLYDTPVWEEEV